MAVRIRTCISINAPRLTSDHLLKSLEVLRCLKLGNVLPSDARGHDVVLLFAGDAEAKRRHDGAAKGRVESVPRAVAVGSAVVTPPRETVVYEIVQQAHC